MFLRMVARPLMAKVTQTTGIKKVPKEPNLRDVLIGLYNQMLKETKKLPEGHELREHVEMHTIPKLNVCLKEEDVEYIPRRLMLPCSRVEDIIKDARDQLNEVCDWHSLRFRTIPWFCDSFLGYPMDDKDTLVQLLNKALKVVGKVPQNNKLRMFAESSINRKLKVCWEESDWESIKIKLDYVDPIQKAQEELDHWTAFFGSDAYPTRSYPLFPRTKEFCERFKAWQELTPKPLLQNLDGMK